MQLGSERVVGFSGGVIFHSSSLKNRVQGEKALWSPLCAPVLALDCVPPKLHTSPPMNRPRIARDYRRGRCKMFGNKPSGDRTGFRAFGCGFPTLASLSYALATADTAGPGGGDPPLLAASAAPPCGGVMGGETAPPAGGGVAEDDDAAVAAAVAAAAVPDPNCCCCCWGRDGRGPPVSMSTAHTDTRLAAHEAARSWRATDRGAANKQATATAVATAATAAAFKWGSRNILQRGTSVPEKPEIVDAEGARF